MLKFINENEFMHAFPNVCVVFRLYLCLMISDCSGERSFSVLKRVKNQLCSSISEKRLNSLALLCIENKLLEKIDTDDIIKSLALSKFRKCVHTNEILCFCIHFWFQLRSVFSKTNRMKNRPLIIMEPQAQKNVNPSLL